MFTYPQMESFFYSIIILMCWSWLYKGDNPLYRIAVNITLGLALAVGLKSTIDVIITKASPLFRGEILALLYLILGIMTLLRFYEGTRAISYWPLAIVAGVGTAIGVKGSVGPLIIRQTIGAAWHGGSLLSNFNQVLIWVSCITLLLWFLFTIRKEAYGGILGNVSRVGFFFMLVAMGASVGAGFIGSFVITTGQAYYLIRYPGYYIVAIGAILIIIDIIRTAKKK